MPLQDILVGDLLGAIDEHRIAPLKLCPAGQSIAYFHQVSTVAEVMHGLVAQTLYSVHQLGRRLGDADA